MLNCVLKMKMLNAALLRSLFLLLLALPTISFSQTYSGYNWYFGNSTNGIRFSRSDGSATFVNNHVNLGSGGGAVASDALNGNLLFYTDGNTIYDRNHTIMGPPPNGTGLAGNTAGNQSVAIAKVPGQDNQYYVFVNTANGTTAGAISYRIVDMSLGGTFGGPPPVGQVTTAANTALALPLTTSEAMMIIPHPNGDDFWLITHANGTPDYMVTHFTPTGPTTTTTFTGLGLIEVAENFSYHPASGRIAVSPQEGNRDVEIITFDPATGGLTFQQRVLNSGVASAPTNPAVYDTEWSHNGQYLYISRSSQAGAPPTAADVLQYDLNNPSTTLASVIPAGLDITNSYGLQMAPDSTIYHLYTTSAGPEILLGQISDTDSVASLVQYDGDPFGNGADFNGKQFPSFPPRDTVPITLSFTYMGTCMNVPTSFYPTVSPGADSLSWDFGDGVGGSSEWSPVYTYETAGTYTVTVTAFLNGQTQTSTQQITITNFDTQITLVQDTTACSCELPFSKQFNPPAPAPPPPPPGNPCNPFTLTAEVSGSGSATYEWYGPSGKLNNQTLTLAPDSAGFYYLVATVGQCEAYAGVNIKEWGIEDQRANIWYFGNQAGLDFNPLPEDPVKAISNPVMNAPQGTATISDRNGQVVFFTDGNQLWDRENTELTTPTKLLGGDPDASQSSIIIPVPGNETLYYIFTTQEVSDGIFELRYSLFDLKKRDGKGDLVQNNVLLFGPSTERITGNANWLIAHEYGNNSFRAYQITANGIGNPVISSVGSDHSFASPSSAEGYMKLGPQNRLAVALATGGSNVVEIFDFADSSGVVSNVRTANLNNAAGQVYGVEFSPGGDRLYATLRGSPAQLVEFSLDSLGNPTLMTPPIPTPGISDLGAIQIGPDAQIYVAIPGSTSLGTITPGVDDDPSTFNPTAPPSLTGTSTLGLPNFIQTIADPVQGPGVSIAGFCLGDTTFFQATPTDPIDTISWTISYQDGSTIFTSKGLNDTDHELLLSSVGNYKAIVKFTNRCGLDSTITQDFRINAKPALVDRTIDLCTDKTLNANPLNVQGLTYLWSTGETTAVITPPRTGTYTVTITNASGCSSVSTFGVGDRRPIVNLGPDLTICQNTPIAPVDAQNPASGTTYAWTINGSPAVPGNARFQPVNTSTAGQFEYKVTVTRTNGCSITDSLTYTINPIPTISPVTIDPSDCTLDNGRIRFTITGPPSKLFSYFIVGNTSSSDTDRPPGFLVDTGEALDAGTYGITVADQVTGCALISTAIVNDGTFDATLAQVGTCSPLPINVTPTGSVTYPVSYKVFDSSTSTEVDNGGPLNAAFPTAGLQPGTYAVEITDSNECRHSEEITLVQGPTVAVSFDLTDICNNNLIAVAPGATTYDWSPPSSLAVPSNTSTAAIKAGQHTITVTADDGPGNLCPGTATTTVVIDDYEAEFAQTDACQDQVTLLVTNPPAGSFTYSWSKNGADAGSGRQIFATIGDDEAFYKLEVLSALNGCLKEVTHQVQVDGELLVNLVSTPPCEGSPFTLTATPTPPNRIPPPSYQWTFDGSAISGQTTTTLQADRAGTYAVKATAESCTATATLPIILNPLTAGMLRETARICPDPANPDPNTRVAILDPGDDADFIAYEWSQDGVPLTVPDPRTLTADQPGIYSVVLTNVFGCKSSDKTNVVVECDPVIVGPNAFRPSSALNVGGEMVNQSFKLFTFFIDDEDFQIFIFNRWGEMIFQSPERDFKWNGGYNNNLSQAAPPGTYSYVVRYKSSYRPEEGIKEKRGGVVLMR
jgi:PKD repeat protein